MSGQTSAMYSIKPIITFSAVNLPTNMYKMKSIYSNNFECELNVFAGNENKSNEVTPLSSSKSAIEVIETKQSIILQQLEQLQTQMDLLRKQLMQTTKSSTGSSKKENMKYVKRASKNIAKLTFQEQGIIHDIVLNANPKFPPYVLLGVQEIWKDYVNLNISSYVHSSVNKLVNEDLLKQFSSSQKVNQTTDVPTLNVTLIWKNIDQDCEFIVSPLSHCTINGEVNILRYFHRQITPDADPIEETNLDSFLDSCHTLVHTTNQKEKQSILRKWNAILGKSEWFGGSALSVKDLAAWSAVRNSENLELVQKLMKWSEQCCKQILCN